MNIHTSNRVENWQESQGEQQESKEERAESIDEQMNMLLVNDRHNTNRVSLSPSNSSSVDTVSVNLVTIPSKTSSGFTSTITLPSFNDQHRHCPRAISPTLRSSPPIDKGWRAWAVVIAAVLIQTFAFAPSEFIFGIFQQEYSHIFPTMSASSIALIGTIGSSTTFLVGFFSGTFLDRWGDRVTALIGSFIMTAALCIASFSTQLWHLYLSQGLLFGIGASLVYFSSVAVPTYWFKKRRGLAMGIAGSGSGLGGFFLAPLTQFLIDQFGVRWALRALGLYSLIICGGASLLFFERDKLDREQRRQEEYQYREVTGRRFRIPKYAKEASFVILAVFQFIISMSYLTPVYFMELYSTHIGINKQLGAAINGWFNGASFITRIFVGFLADFLASDILLLVCSWTSTLAIFILWTFSKSFPVYLSFAIVYGISFSGITTVTPIIVANQYGSQYVSRVLGVVYGFSCLALVSGSFISGHILEMTKHQPDYLPVIMYSGGMFAGSSFFASIWVVLLRKQNRQNLANRRNNVE